MALSMRVLLLGLALGASLARAEGLPNGSFEEGGETPDGWRLQGAGSWERGEDGRRVSVRGNGEDSSYWHTVNYALAPNALYRMSFRTAARAATGGCVISGPEFCNRDFRTEPGWHEHSFIFATPDADQASGAYVRVGQWHVTGEVRFDDVQVSPTHAVHRRAGDVELGEGEQLEETAYAFEAPFRSDGSNYSRPLHAFNARFNSSRWVLSAESEVVYRHSIPGAAQRSAAVEVNCNYHVSGAGAVEASTDGISWVGLGRFDGTGSLRADVPARLLPAGTLYVRVRAVRQGEAGAAEAALFQFGSYHYAAQLDADLGELTGATVYPDVRQTSDTVRVTIVSAPGPAGLADDAFRVRVENRRRLERALRIRALLTPEDGETSVSEQRLSLPPGAGTVASVPCPLRRSGVNSVTLELLESGEALYRAAMDLPVAALHDSSFGRALPSEGPVALWWCEGTRKVSRLRPPPSAVGAAVELQAARNEYEPVQLILLPASELADVRLSVSDLAGPGATLSAGHVSIAQVAYVKVVRPTDSAGAAGYWPDPLPPYEQGQTLEAGVNHPFWLTVYVPADQPAGDYTGTVNISADGWQASVPLKLRVCDFTLPATPRLQTALGLSTHFIRQYHNLETNDELRRVLDLYHRDFAAHRIAPYSPAPLDPIRVEFPAVAWEGGTHDSDRPHAGERSLKVVDENVAASVAASSAAPVPVDASASYRLSWWARTAEPDQPYLVSIQQYDAGGQWIWGNNINFRRTGTGRWQQEDADVPGAEGRLNERARSVRVALRAVPWTPDGEAVGTAWFDDLHFSPAGGGDNLLSGPGFELAAEDPTATLDFTAFDRECGKCLDGLGFSSMMVRLQGMPGGSFHSRREGRLGPFVQGSPGYGQLMASQGRQIVEHLRERGWLDRAYVYWFDEPAPKDYEFVVEGMDLLGRAAPGLTRMLTEQPEPALTGHVDLWCPVVSAVKPEAIRERKGHGERFWWYLCTGPKAPYIGLFIDRPATDLRVWAWLSRKWGVEGQLVWSSNYWTSTAAFPPPDVQNPWQDPMAYVSSYSYKPGQIGYWGNGDGRFLYPPNRDVKGDEEKYLCGPVDSVRWEMLREGVEDYDYFCLLDELIAQAEAAGKAAGLIEQARALAAVPDAVIADDQTYSKDPGPLYAHRRRVAGMIEQLRRALR